jgi:alpha-glucosidase
VARTIRQAVERANADALVVAEHGFDASLELGGDGWHGVMAYAGFTRPAWTWLVSDAGPSSFLGVPTPVPRLPGGATARTMTEFRAAIPWRAATHSLNLLDSHDTPRIRTVTGDRERQLVGAALMFTTPGIPMVFAGDEVGVEGHEDPDNRRPMPWDRARWDAAIWDGYRRLARIRRSTPPSGVEGSGGCTSTTTSSCTSARQPPSRGGLETACWSNWPGRHTRRSGWRPRRSTCGRQASPCSAASRSCRAAVS